MLPEIELYCPPITIRAVDCRNFGRFVLVGTHVINHIHKFMYVPQTRKDTARKANEGTELLWFEYSAMEG